MNEIYMYVYFIPSCNIINKYIPYLSDSARLNTTSLRTLKIMKGLRLFARVRTIVVPLPNRFYVYFVGEEFGKPLN